MKRNYFDYNGQRYFTGTVLMIKTLSRKVQEAIFVCYDSDMNRYIIKTNGTTWFETEQSFYKSIIEITNRVDNAVHLPQTKQLKDSQINGLPLGWMWYIFLMAIVSIFKDNIGLWILISVVFFSWRSEKIQKGGTYIEW